MSFILYIWDIIACILNHIKNAPWETIFIGLSAFLSSLTLCALYFDKRQSIRPPINYFCSRDKRSGMLKIRVNLGRLENIPYTLKKITVVHPQNDGVIQYEVEGITEKELVNQKSIWHNRRKTPMKLIVQPTFANISANKNIILVLYVYVSSSFPAPSKRLLQLHFKVDRFPWRTSFSFKIEDVAHSTYA